MEEQDYKTQRHFIRVAQANEWETRFPEMSDVLRAWAEDAQ